LWASLSAHPVWDTLYGARGQGLNVIPEKVIRFLEHQGNIGLAGLRDESLMPFGIRVCGWKVGAGGRTLTVFMPELRSDRTIGALVGNGQLAVTIEEFPLHETYQIKGRYLSHRPIRPEEVELVNRTRERMAAGVRHLVSDEGPVDQLRASIPDATLAVEIAVHEVFVQTPGPEAGARLAPPEAEPRL
jgi:hypothetical protein